MSKEIGLFEAINTLRSIRRFKPIPVENVIVRELGMSIFICFTIFFRGVGVENPEKFLRLSLGEIKELLLGLFEQA